MDEPVPPSLGEGHSPRRTLPALVRDHSLDAIKGVAIALMIWGHVVQSFYQGEAIEYLRNPVYRFIYAFHMPLFALVSGYFLEISLRRRAPGEVVLKRFQTLGGVIVVWSSIGMMAEGFYNLPFDEADLSVWWRYFTGGFLWFLWSTIAAALAIAGASFLPTWWLRLAGQIVGGFVVSALFPNPQYNAFVYPFFLLGYYWRPAWGRYVTEGVRVRDDIRMLWERALARSALLRRLFTDETARAATVSADVAPADQRISAREAGDIASGETATVDPPAVNPESKGTTFEPYGAGVARSGFSETTDAGPVSETPIVSQGSDFGASMNTTEAARSPMTEPPNPAPWYRRQPRSFWYQVIGGVGAFAIFLVLLPFFEPYAYIYVSGVTNGLEYLGTIGQIWVNVYRFALGLSGSVWVIVLVRLVITHIPPLLRILADIGRHSLNYYAMQTVLILWLLTRNTFYLDVLFGIDFETNIPLLCAVVTPIVTLLGLTLIHYLLVALDHVPRVRWFLFYEGPFPSKRPKPVSTAVQR
ncbi:MAG: acyltransferase family protein [Propionibacteriaceae bacterium]|jgi:hypothetical protein|nr:acyltransferase family protein [Propionibacteriaceae bacterium]